MTSLFRLEKQGDVEQLVRLLRESDSASVRERAAEILGELDDPDERAATVEALVEAVQLDDDDAVRAAAIDALDQHEAVQRLLATLAGEEIRQEGADWVKAEAFVDALGDEQPEMRMAAANALGRNGNPAGAEPLAARLTDPNPRVRARAARALGRIGVPGAVSGLAERLHDDSVNVRREAADALGRIGTDEALSALLELLDDESETIRHIAASSFGNFDSSKPVDALVELLSDDVDAVRRAAVFSLIEVLSNAPPAQSHQLRKTVVERMSATEDANVMRALVDILDEGVQSHQRRNAAWLLGRVTDDENPEPAIETLVDILSDDDDMTAQFAATSLVAIGGEPTEEALLDVLDDLDANADARAKAAFALGKVGGERSRERLSTIIDHTDDDDVRKQAFSALSKLGGRL